MGKERVIGKYIDADKVLKELHLNHKDVIYIDKNDTAKRIEKIQGIDIVRCKECKEWDKNDHECYLDRGGLYFPNADDFCSYGERKDKCKECWYWSEVHKRCENKCGCQFKPYGERSRR